MRIAVIGSRNFTNWELLEQKLNDFKFPITQIISGGARGADKLAEKYAKIKNIPIKVYIPDWEKYGKGAGFIRNTQIVESADTVIAFWDTKSRGTKRSIELARKMGKSLYVFQA